MAKYCPTWIIDCIIAEASIDFIELEVGLEFISKKYTEGIRDIYEDVENVNIYEGVKRIVEFCVSEEINQNSNIILSQFSYYKFYFVNKKSAKKLYENFIPFNHSADMWMNDVLRKIDAKSFWAEPSLVVSKFNSKTSTNLNLFKDFFYILKSKVINFRLKI